MREASKTRRKSAPAGRPAFRLRRHVPDDILLAAETWLELRSPHDISTRDISTLANTRPSMVNYYFGSKDGLLVEIVERWMKDIERGFIETRDAILRGEIDNPTRAMIAAFADVFNRRPAFCRMLITEVFRDGSPIRTHFFQHWPRHGRLMMEDTINHLCATGQYRAGVDIDAVCTLIPSVVFFPLIVTPSLIRGRNGDELDLSNRWIAFTTEVLDRYLRQASR